MKLAGCAVRSCRPFGTLRVLGLFFQWADAHGYNMSPLRGWIHFVPGFTSSLDSLRDWIHFVAGLPVRRPAANSWRDGRFVAGLLPNPLVRGPGFQNFSLPANSRENHSKHSGKNSFCDQLAFRSHFRQTRRTMFVSFQDSK